VNEEQLKLFLRQAFALSRTEASILDMASPALLRAMSNIRKIVGDNLPDESLMREKIWRELRPLIAMELQPLNDSFAQSIYSNISDELPEIADQAAAMVRAAGIQPLPLPQLPLGASTEAVLRTKVGGRRLLDLLSASDTASGYTPFVRSNLEAINRRVISGILKGSPTPEIADEIAMIYLRNAKEYISLGGPSAAREIRANMNAIARTAVQDANRQVHEEVYKANAEALSDLQWEWVAVLDSRTCPTCAPLDGRREDNRKDLPTWPRHINCRCMVVAVDPDEEADVRSGQIVSSEPFTYKGKTLDEMTKAERKEALGKGRLYATEAKVNGTKLNRKAVDVKPGKDGKPPTYADFLAQSNQKTQQMFFGGGAAGAERAKAFQRAIDRGSSPEKALRDLIDTRDGVGHFKPMQKV